MDGSEAKLLVISDRELINIGSICRICANEDDKLVGIYSSEGISNDIANKINMYLPIDVSERDPLPLQCCINCLNTILTWHELVVTSAQADIKMKNCHFVTDKVVEEISIEDDPSEGTGPHPLPTTSLNVFCQTNKTEEQDEELVMFNQRDKKIVDVQAPTSSLGEGFSCLTTMLDGQNLDPDYKVETIENPVFEKEEPDTGDFDDDSEEDPLASKLEGADSDYFACEFCPGMLLMRDDYVKHFKRDHPEKSCSIKADQVRKEKRKNMKIDQEMTNAAKVVVDGRIYYNCRECGKSLHSPYTYVWHMRIHTGERPYICDLCGKQFRVSQGLVRHLRETHQGIKKFSCDLCGRMFATRRNVEEHRRIHTNERPYICDLCGKAFKQKASLFVHKRSHKNYFPFKCSYCNQGFRTKPPLMVHITRHTGEKPYKCDICGRCFRIKYELKRHRLIHSDEKPFSCNLCGLSFRQKRYLRNHTKTNHSLST